VSPRSRPYRSSFRTSFTTGRATWRRRLREEYANHIREIDGWYISTLDQDVWIDEFTPDEKIDRKKFALTVQKGVDGIRPPEEYRGFMFSLLDGKDISAKVWSIVEPQAADR
jgi:hypothetical protein